MGGATPPGSRSPTSSAVGWPSWVCASQPTTTGNRDAKRKRGGPGHPSPGLFAFPGTPRRSLPKARSGPDDLTGRHLLLALVTAGSSWSGPTDRGGRGQWFQRGRLVSDRGVSVGVEVS